MGRVTFILAAVLVFAASASAAVTMDFTCNYLYGGYSAYDFYLRTTDGQLASWAANIGFQGWDYALETTTRIYQVKSGTTIVNNEGWIMEDPEAPGEYLGDGWRFFKEMAGFDETIDTWTFNPFAPIPGSNPIPGGPALSSGYAQTMTSFAFSLGTPEGSQLGDRTPLAHVVVQGRNSCVKWTGQTARLGQDYGHSPTLGPTSNGFIEESYVISPGETLRLSSDWHSFTQWDLDCGLSVDRRGFETTPDGNEEVSYAYLLSLGLQPGSTYEIAGSNYGGLHMRGTTLTITPEPATLAMLALGAMTILRRRRK